MSRNNSFSNGLPLQNYQLIEL